MRKRTHNRDLKTDTSEEHDPKMTDDVEHKAALSEVVGHTLAACAGLCGALAASAGKLALAAESAQDLCSRIVDGLHSVSGNIVTMDSGALCVSILLYIRLGCFAMIFVFNAIMWTLFVKSLQHCSSTLVATVTNSGTNIFCTAVIGWLLFEETLTLTWFCGASLIVIGLILIHHGSPQLEEQRTETGKPHGKTS